MLARRHFALTAALLPKLREQGTPSRVVVLSSAAHRWQNKPLNFSDLDFRCAAPAPCAQGRY